MKYIDADLLRNEIEFAKSIYNNPKRVVHGVADAFRQDGRAAMCDDILKKIDSLQQEQDIIIINKKDWEAQEQFRKNKDFGKPLQQEQPRVELEKEIQRYLREECSGDDEPTVSEIAHHFYEIGLRRAAEMYDEIEYNRQRAEEESK